MQTARSDVCEMLAAQAYHATSDHVHYCGERELLLLRTPISDVRFRFYYVAVYAWLRPRLAQNAPPEHFAGF